MNIKNKFNYTNQNKKEVEDIVKEIVKLRENLKNQVETKGKPKGEEIFKKLASDFKVYYQTMYKKLKQEYDEAVKSGNKKDIKDCESKLQEFKNESMIKAFAICSEAIREKMNGIEAYEVQLQAAVAMTRDNVICDMKTGEGKTLVQIFTSYINALTGEGVHIITANDYLAERDCGDNEKVFKLLGLSCGYIPSNDRLIELGIKPDDFISEKKKLYNRDIIYATGSTIVFDYLNTKAARTLDDRIIRRPLNYAIVDEADSILLDEATTPIILTKSAEDIKKDKKEIKLEIKTYEDYLADPEFRKKVEEIVKNYTYKLNKEFTIDDKGNAGIHYFKNTNSVYIGTGAQNKLLKEYLKKKIDVNDKDFFPLMEAFQLYTEALLCCKKNEQYYVEETKDKKGKPIKKVVLIDANVGRGTNKRLRAGLHQALEAKEGVEIKSSVIEKARTTYPTFFSKYKNGISGMTGSSNQEEFNELYGLQTYEVPTRLTNIRKDMEDELYKTKAEKYKKIVADVIAHHKKGQPILIGTCSVEESEYIAKLLSERGITHRVLNAVQNKNEKQIIEAAGEIGRVTVSTNMAGRGTDIKLSQEALAKGGLYVISTTYNNSLRIDDQLRGRASRQGQAGKTKFYVSLEDEIVFQNDPRLYEETKNKSFSGPITNKSIKERVKHCQTIRESNDYARRKYQKEIGAITDEVMEKIYESREKLLESDSIHEILGSFVDSYAKKLSTKSPEEIELLVKAMVPPTAANKFNYNNTEELCRVLPDFLKKYSAGLDTAEKQGKLKGYTKLAKQKMLRVVDDYISILLDEYDMILKSTPLLAVFKSKDAMEVFRDEMLNTTEEKMEFIQNELIAYALSGIKYGEYKIPEYVESKSMLEEKGIRI